MHKAGLKLFCALPRIDFRQLTARVAGSLLLLTASCVLG